MFASELHPRLPRHPKMKASSQTNRLHLFLPEALGWEKEKKGGSREEEGTFRQTLVSLPQDPQANLLSISSLYTG